MPMTSGAWTFSYSGIKTAVLRYVETHDMRARIEQRRAGASALTTPTREQSAGRLRSRDPRSGRVVPAGRWSMIWSSKTLSAAREHNVATVLVTGGVAANSELRAAFEREAAEEGLPVLFPSRKLSTDNAAMIAAAAYPRFIAGEFADAGIIRRRRPAAAIVSTTRHLCARSCRRQALRPSS